jgi:hypothetical protein
MARKRFIMKHWYWIIVFAPLFFGGCTKYGESCISNMNFSTPGIYLYGSFITQEDIDVKDEFVMHCAYIIAVQENDVIADKSGIEMIKSQHVGQIAFKNGRVLRFIYKPGSGGGITINGDKYRFELGRVFVAVPVGCEIVLSQKPRTYTYYGGPAKDKLPMRAPFDGAAQLTPLEMLMNVYNMGRFNFREIVDSTMGDIRHAQEGSPGGTVEGYNNMHIVK